MKYDEVIKRHLALKLESPHGFACRCGVGRSTVYAFLEDPSRAKVSSVVRMLEALGYTLSAEPVSGTADPGDVAEALRAAGFEIRRIPRGPAPGPAPLAPGAEGLHAGFVG